MIVLLVPGVRLLSIAPWAAALYYGALTVGAIAVFRQPAPERARIAEDEDNDLLLDDALPRAEGFSPAARDSGPFAEARNAAVGAGIVESVSQGATSARLIGDGPSAAKPTAGLTHLIALLDSGERVLWSEVQDLLRGFPGFEGMVDVMRQPRGRMSQWLGTTVSDSELYVSDSVRRALASNIRPHAILLETRDNPPACVARLESEAGVDPEAFLTECLRNRTPEVAAAAKDVLNARIQQATLLRAAKPGPGARPDDATALLRAAVRTDGEESE